MSEEWLHRLTQYTSFMTCLEFGLVELIWILKLIETNWSLEYPNIVEYKFTWIYLNMFVTLFDTTQATLGSGIGDPRNARLMQASKISTRWKGKFFTAEMPPLDKKSKIVLLKITRLVNISNNCAVKICWVLFALQHLPEKEVMSSERLKCIASSADLTFLDDLTGKW